MVRYKLSSSKF